MWCRHDAASYFAGFMCLLRVRFGMSVLVLPLQVLSFDLQGDSVRAAPAFGKHRTSKIVLTVPFQALDVQS